MRDSGITGPKYESLQKSAPASRFFNPVLHHVLQWISSTASSVMTADLRSLALFRICVGSVVLVDLLDRLPDVRVFYSDSGVLSREMMIHSADFHRFATFQLMNGSVWFQYLYFALLFVVAISFIVGFKTRLSSIALWAMMLSLQARNPQIGYGLDVVLRLSLLWGAFLPLGERFSLDRVLADVAETRDRAQGRKTARGPNRYCAPAVLGLFLLLASIYVFTAVLKSQHVAWMHGRGLYFALSLDEYVMPLGLAILGHPALIRLANNATVIIEAFAWILLFVPWRKSWIRFPLFFLFLFFHMGMGLCLNVVFFQFAAAAAWTCVLPQAFWVQARRRLRKKRALFRRWREKLESLVSRHLVPRVSGGSVGISGQPGNRRAIVRDSVACVLMATCLYWNFFEVAPKRFPAPDTLNDFVLAVGLDQRWDMFADPATASGWFVIPAMLADGSEVDLLHGGAPLSWDKPDGVYHQFRDERWRKMLLLLTDSNADPSRLAYGQYLCRTWNGSHEDPTKKLEAFKIFMMNQVILPEGGKGIIHQIFLWRHECGNGLLEKWKSKLGP